MTGRTKRAKRPITAREQARAAAAELAAVTDLVIIDGETRRPRPGIDLYADEPATDGTGVVE